MPQKANNQNQNYILRRLAALPWRGITIIVAGLVAISLITGLVHTYNQIVILRNTADAQWQQVEVQYQRRLDLIPNMVAVAKRAQLQESSVFIAVADARSHYGSATSVNDKAAAATQLDSALGKLIAVEENYPQLKSNELMLNLQSELASTENRIGAERLAYNDYVLAYNTYIKEFPKNIMANVFGYQPKVYFKSSLGAQLAPAVDFGEQR